MRENMVQRAKVIITRGDSILLMYRRRLGREYYILPGGEVHAGETLEQAAIRETKEETGLDVVIERELFMEENELGQHHCFSVEPVSGEPVLGGEEAGFNSELDTYRLEWVPFESLPNMVIVSEKTKELLLSIPEIKAVIAAKASSLT
jgi:8-oxo-dGTP diphosphatase